MGTCKAIKVLILRMFKCEICATSSIIGFIFLLF